MLSLWQDVRFGFRTLARSPAFTTVALLTLALGIGATSSVFTVVNAVLLGTLPYLEPERLVLVNGVRSEGASVEDWPISYLDFLDWRRESTVFQELAAHTQARSFNLLTDGEPEHVDGEMAAAATFRLLGLDPILGRSFSPEEDTAPGGHRVVVVSHDFWRHRLGGAPDVVGRSLTLNDASYQVIGVLPAGFRGLSDQAELWLPLATASSVLAPRYLEWRDFRWLSAVGRLAPGVTIEAAQAAMDALTAQLEEAYPEANRGIGVELRPLSEAWFGDLRFPLLSLLGGAAMVLLIACANVASLLLARVSARRQEMTIRGSLGAGRRRLVRQLLTESAMLALLGAALGLLIARWATGLLVAASAVDFRSFIRLAVDLRVLGVIVAVALACGVGFGVVPAWSVARTPLASALNEGARGVISARRRRFQGALVVAEVALALALFIGASLMIKGFQGFLATDLGFRPDGLLTLRIDYNSQQYADRASRQVFVRQLQNRLSDLPGIAAMALEGPGLPTDDWHASPFTIEGRQDTAGERGALMLPRHNVGPGYFATLGVPLLAGRDFTVEDTQQAGPPSVIVSAGLAERFWPGQDAVGKRLKFGEADSPAPWFGVVGVVGDVRHAGLKGSERPPTEVYLPILRIPPDSPPVVNLLVRPADGFPRADLLAAVQEQVRAVGPSLPLYDVTTMEERLSRQTASDRFLVLLMTLFALLALLLAAGGIYGLVAYTVSQGRREIGIRMALGARRRDVLLRTVGRAAALALAGIALGLAGSLLLGRLFRSLFYGLGAGDPTTLAGACLALATAAALAGYLPARRAVRIDPAITLRQE